MTVVVLEGDEETKKRHGKKTYIDAIVIYGQAGTLNEVHTEA